MTPKRPQKILAEHSSEGLESRPQDAEKLYLAAVSGGGVSHIHVKGTPRAGLSELLKQTYDRLFLEQRFVVPFYFALRHDDSTAKNAADRFVYEFLLQSIAFRRSQPTLIAASPDARELERLAPLPDAEWVRSMIGEADGTVRSALAAPLRAAARAGFAVCMTVDDLHNSALIANGEEFVNGLSRLAAPAGSSSILASRRNFELPNTSGKTFLIDRPSVDDASTITDRLASAAEVEITASVRDLIVAATERRPGYVGAIVSAARDSALPLTTYRDAARVYSAEIANGTLAREVRSDVGIHRRLAEELHTAAGTDSPFRLSALGERLGISGDELSRIEKHLSSAEIVELSGEMASVSNDAVLREVLSFDHAMLLRAAATAAAANVALRFLRNAPGTMAREYRRSAAAGLSELLSMFDGREVPRAVIDYRTFRDRYKGLTDAEIRVQVASDNELFSLPQILQAAALVDFAPSFSREAEPERAVAGVGFSARSYRAEDEIVWIAGELDSKLEADPELVREWCSRLDEAASQAGFERYRFWLVAPEGFSPGALELLAERNGIGSSRRQLNLLRETLRGKTSDAAAHEYEMTIPIGDETELIAVHAIEEVARRASFPAKAINQIKTALVEACINAAEHGLSPDRKVYLKFATFDDRLVLTVSNRGLRLADKVRDTSPDSELSSDTRRGWGLGLMRNLMDDVRVEAVDDGTRIVMTKLRPRE